MNKKTKVVIKIGTTVSVGCAVLSLAILLTTLTYSWIRRKWATKIYDDNIRIETTGSLAFILDGQTTAKNFISIPEILGMQNFTLKPVSNATGESYDFFVLDRESDDGDRYRHLPAADLQSEYMTQGKAYGYIEIKFQMMGENTTGKSGQAADDSADYTKYVYLSMDNSELQSFFREYADAGTKCDIDPSYALRIAITTKDGDSNQYITRIFMKEREGQERPMHTGVNPIRSNMNDTETLKSQKWFADGQFYWGDDGVNIANKFSYSQKSASSTSETEASKEYNMFQSTEAFLLSDFDGGIEERDGARYINKEKCLLWFPGNQKTDVVVRIWIEGTDQDYCNDDISGGRLELLLNFEAVNCDSTGKIIERVDKTESSEETKAAS